MNEEPLFINEQSLSVNAYDAAAELIQTWETLPYYLDENKPLHGVTIPHDSNYFRQYLRVPRELLPTELQADALNAPPKRQTVQKQVQPITRNIIDKKETNKLMKEEHINEVYTDDDEADDYDAVRFEDYDQEDDMSDANSED